MKNGKTIVVTGASSGIGRATATLLLENGYCVIGLARDFSKARIDNARFQTLETDLSRLDELPARLEDISRSPGTIDGVICCAGTGRFGGLEEFSYGQIRALIDLNLTSQIYVARTFLPGMKRQGSGDLVFLGSEAALAGGRRGALYSAAKFGLRGLAQSLRQECAASGVRICIINPGMVRTEFFDELNFTPGEEESNYIVPEDVARTVLSVLQARSGTVFDEINLSPQKKVVHFRPSGDN